MSEYCHGSHTIFSIHLHSIWITKYRHKVRYQEVQVTISHLIQRMKGKSSYHRLREFPHLRKQFLGMARRGAEVFLPQQWEYDG